jgi:hypothetical protein
MGRRRTKVYGKGPNLEVLNNIYIFPSDDEKVVVMSLAAISEKHIKRKNALIMRDVISVYHPDFISPGDVRTYGFEKPDSYNITRLVEESLAAIGPYEHIDEYGYDFTDYSDSKTATVSTYDNSLTIGNVQNKIGALRIVAYNPHTDKLDYFYIPKSVLAEYKERHTKNTDRIRTAWTEETDSYNFFQMFRYYSFEAMAFAGHEQIIEVQNNEISDTSFSVSDIESVKVSSKKTRMKVAKQYTIEELNKMSVPAAKKNAIRLGIPRTPHPPQSEFTHPICITASCTNPKTVNDWHWTSGLPVYKDICIKCHNKAVASKHGLTRISQVVAKNKATEQQNDSNLHGTRNIITTKVLNITG